MAKCLMLGLDVDISYQDTVYRYVNVHIQIIQFPLRLRGMQVCRYKVHTNKELARPTIQKFSLPHPLLHSLTHHNETKSDI